MKILIPTGSLRLEGELTIPVEASPDLAEGASERVTAPTLLLVGGLDTQVLQLNQEAFAQLQCEKAMEIIPGATHLFEEAATLEMAAGKAAGWFLEHLTLKNL